MCAGCFQNAVDGQRVKNGQTYTAFDKGGRHLQGMYFCHSLGGDPVSDEKCLGRGAHRFMFQRGNEGEIPDQVRAETIVSGVVPVRRDKAHKRNRTDTPHGQAVIPECAKGKAKVVPARPFIEVGQYLAAVLCCNLE